MSIMARTSAEAAPAIHGITGLAAILLMLFHAGWATHVYFQGKRGGAAALKRERTFHRLSAAVWVAWLVPYVIGMLVGIPMIKLDTVPAVIASLVVAARDCGRFPVHPTPAGVETRGTRRGSSTPAPARSSPSGTTASRSPGPP